MYCFVVIFLPFWIQGPNKCLFFNGLVVSAVDGGQLRGDGSKQVGSHKMVKIGKIYSLKSFLLRFELGIKSKNLVYNII